MRPGCDREVAARLTFDPVGCAVWLDPPVLGDEPVQQVCSIHAATLTVPLGWTVTDRRFEATSSAATPPRRTPEPVAAPVAKAPPEPVEAPVAKTPPEPVEAPVAPPAPEPVERPAAAAATPPPVESAAVEHAAVEHATAEGPSGSAPGDSSPTVVVRRRRDDRRPSLLDRALRSSGPQHSVLTHQQDASEPGADDVAPLEERADAPDPDA